MKFMVFLEKIKEEIEFRKILYQNLKELTDPIFDKLYDNISETIQHFCDVHQIQMKYLLKINFKPRII